MRGWLSTTALGLFSAVPLIGHLLVPRRYAQLREWMNNAFLPEPRTELTLMRNTAQAQDALTGLLMGFASQVALLLGDERGHNRVIQGYMDSAAGSIEMRHLAIEMFYIG